MFVVLRNKDEEMEQKSTLGGHVGTGVDRLTGDALREAPVAESHSLLAGEASLGDTRSASTPTFDGLPARRIQFRYWFALLALGAAIWAVILFWLL